MDALVKEEGLSLLLVSCDKYMDIVRVFEQSAVKYWSDCPYRKYLLTESEGTGTNFFDVTLKAGKGMQWSDCLLYAVKEIPTRHILIMLDDFILSAPVDSSKIESAFCIAKKKDAGIFKLSPRDSRGRAGETDEGLSFCEIGKDEPYRVSVNPPAIWDTDFIVRLLGTERSVSAWDFEREGTVWAKELSDRAYRLSEEEPFTFFNPTGDGAVGRGRLVKTFRDFCIREGFELNTGRGEMSWKDNAGKAVKSFIYRLNPSLILRVQQWLFEHKQEAGSK